MVHIPCIMAILQLKHGRKNGERNTTRIVKFRVIRGNQDGCPF